MLPARPSATRWLSFSCAFADSISSSRRLQPFTKSISRALLYASTKTRSQLCLGPLSNGTVRQLTHTSRDIMYSSVRVCVTDYFVPGQCIPFGFRTRLLMRAILPLVLLAAILLGTIVVFYCRSARGLSTHSRWLSDALMVSAPIALFGSFILCPTVSKGIFDTWDCTEYELDSATGEMRTFLNSDLQIVCSGNEHPEEYDTIKIIAYIFVLLWPIGMPVIFLLVLWPNRKALRQRRSTRMVQATSFLHKEYDPSYFWWEVVSLAQRLILTGWVLLIPVEYDAWRIFLGLLTSIGCG